MLNKDTVKSDKLLSLANEFCEKRAQGLSLKRHNEKIKKDELVIAKYFGDVEFNNISSDFIILALKKCAMSNEENETLVLIRFIHHLIQNALTFEKYEIFEAYYETQFRKQTNASKAIILLTDSKFETYYNEGLYTSLKGCQLSFANLGEYDFQFEETEIQVEKYLESIKFYSEMSLDYRYTSFVLARKSLFDFLADKDINILTRIDVATHFSNVNLSNAKNEYYIMKFLLFLADQQYYADKRFDFIKELRNYINNGGYTHDLLIEILANETPHKYCYYISTGKESHLGHLVYIDTESEEIRNCVKEYLSQRGTARKEQHEFFRNFSCSLGNYAVNNVFDFSFNSFLYQTEYAIKVLKSQPVLACIIAFYNFIYHSYNANIFTDSSINATILIRVTLTGELFRGFEIVSLNPFEKVPTADKILLHYKTDDKVNSDITSDCTMAIDFGDIHCQMYKDWCKHYVWHGEISLFSRTRSILKMKQFFNYIYGIKKGTELSIYGKKTDSLLITVEDVLAYKTYLFNKNENSKTRWTHMQVIKDFLRYVIDNNLGTIDDAALNQLTTYSGAAKEKELVEDENLIKLFTIINKKAKMDKLNFMLSTAVYLAICTEFRASQILKLEVNCVGETAKNGEYVVNSKNKTSKGNKLFHSITTYTKDNIEAAIEMTNEWRQASPSSEVRKYIFIQPAIKRNNYSIIRPYSVRKYLSQCCKEAGIENCTLDTLRHLHMTKGKEYLLRNGLSDVEQHIIGGHQSLDVEDMHYVHLDIKDMLEASYGIIIGNIEIAGKVTHSFTEVEKAVLKEKKVSNECGYCGCDNCHNYSFLGCLLCVDFVATIDRIPFFEEQIGAMDLKIKNSTLPHDKEDYISIKRLLVNYLYRLISLREGSSEQCPN